MHQQELSPFFSYLMVYILPQSVTITCLYGNWSLPVTSLHTGGLFSRSRIVEALNKQWFVFQERVIEVEWKADWVGGPLAQSVSSSTITCGFHCIQNLSASIMYSLKEKGVKDVSKCNESQQHVEVVEIAGFLWSKACGRKKMQARLKPAWTLRTSQHLHQSPHIMVALMNSLLQTGRHLLSGQASKRKKSHVKIKPAVVRCPTDGSLVTWLSRPNTSLC